MANQHQSQRSADDLHGLLVVDKPGLPLGVHRVGCPDAEHDLPTSHDVVQRVRRWSRQRRIGHTGTLDPMASGILVLCLGGATRLVEYYQGHDKVYDAEITLGLETDTYDALGEVVDQRPVPALDRDTVAATLATFVGTIAQKPPIYSALKQGGESLHRKARRGEEVQVDARPVTIHRLDLLDLTPPGPKSQRLRVRVHCSAGTYVRSLAHDLGAALETCGHLSYLRRSKVGSLSLEEAHCLSAIERAVAEERLPALLLPPGAHLSMPIVFLEHEESRRIGFGQKVWLAVMQTQARPEAVSSAGAILRAVDDQDRFLGTLVVLDHSADGESILVKADKWLAPLLYGTT